MNEQDLVRLYQRSAVRRTPERAECASPEALLDAAERRGPEDARIRTINHAMACAECGEELELLRASRVVRERARTPRTAFALAASLILAAGLGYLGYVRRAASGDADDLTRGNTGDVTLVSPAGTVSRLDSLRWRAVPNATSYTAELRRDDGTVVTRATTTDTTLALPDSARAELRGSVYWTVSARLSDGSELRSAARRIRVRVTTP